MAPSKKKTSARKKSAASTRSRAKTKRRTSKARLSSSRRILIVLILFSIGCSIFAMLMPARTVHSREEILTLVEHYAAKEGISDHIPELKAIVTVESNWEAEDVFQSSESLGLPPNSLSTRDSIKQGVHYYRTLLDKAQSLGVDQDAVFQAYNFGSGYLDYVAQNGKKHTAALAEAFSAEHAKGIIVAYPNPIAIERNGGWRYQYGNMFYVDLIHQHLEPASSN